jgi:DNA-binding NarL/FixJ family response regulator
MGGGRSLVRAISVVDNPIRAEFPAIPVVVISASEDPVTVSRALDYGASGFVPKSAPSEHLAEATRAVLARALPRGEEMAERRHILIADDHPLMRSALAQGVARALPDVELLEAASLDQVFAALRDQLPDTPWISSFSIFTCRE